MISTKVLLRALPREEGLSKRLIDWVSSTDAVPTALRDVLSQAAAGFGAHDAKTSSVINDYWQAIADQIAQTLRTIELMDVPAVVGVHLEGDRLEVETEDLSALGMALPGTVGAAAVRVTRFEPIDASLESVFRHLLRIRQ